MSIVTISNIDQTYSFYLNEIKKSVMDHLKDFEVIYDTVIPYFDDMDIVIRFIYGIGGDSNISCPVRIGYNGSEFDFGNMILYSHDVLPFDYADIYNFIKYKSKFFRVTIDWLDNRVTSLGRGLLVFTKSKEVIEDLKMKFPDRNIWMDPFSPHINRSINIKISMDHG